jgi:hypothetical protein
MKNELNFEIFRAAHEAGHEAAMAAIHEAMVVTDGKNFWHCDEGLCGFAWVGFKGNTSFGRWTKQNKLTRKSYTGGLHLWVSDYNQSYDRKRAYAEAFARKLNEYGIEAYSDSRLD